MPKEPHVKKKKPSGPNLFAILGPYRSQVALLVVFAILTNALSLWLPKIIADGIDAYARNELVMSTTVYTFIAVTVAVFVFAALQSVIQTLLSERSARDIRQQLADKISRQTNAYIQTTSPSTLLTNLTSDIDSIKLFVSQAIVSLISSLIIIIGAAILLLSINWKLALVVLMVIPLIGGTFGFIFGKVGVLFKQSREVIDWLNRVINESILGAALIRVLNSQKSEHEKFLKANTDAQRVGLRILAMFAAMIPIVTFMSNLATLAILALGGHFVIDGSMSLGSFAAFNSYLMMLIFPIFVLGFMSNIMAQAGASYGRIRQVLDALEEAAAGTLLEPLRGDISVKDVTLSFGEKSPLKQISFDIKHGTRTAIIGPTAAGKTQLLNLLVGLIKPTSGEIHFDGHALTDYDPKTFYRQIGFVFQDSIVFNMSIRENIAFSEEVSDASLQKAIETAELTDFIQSLPEKLDSVISERGTSLSGGQKQRLMLARALALNPKVLFLDDFTARVDANTEQKILANVRKNYPDLTLLSVTQKVSSVEGYDQIIVLMEGELLAIGTHQELLHSSPEYVQIHQSQRSTSHYELQPE